MRYTAAAVAVVVGLAAATSPNYTAPVLSQYSKAEISSGKAFHQVSKDALARIKYNVTNRISTSNSNCSYDKAKVRKEFRNMTLADREAFVNAVTCLTQTPPQVMTKAEKALYPGVKSRHDEYVATHINYTDNIHMTADFLAWHRYYIWTWEKDLRTLCNYTGNLPYWDWAIDSDAPQDSEMFNGDKYSMGSNGAVVSGREPIYLYTQGLTLPPGTGGGCVTKGPFSNYTVNMGPLDSPYGKNVNSSFEYNPKCLRRDFNPWVSSNYNTYTNLTELLLAQTTIGDFQALMQGYNSATNKFGIHGGGHWQGGDSALMDFHSSPSDPLFFLHHAMVDRVWSIWQGLDLLNRRDAINGTSTLDNSPPSAEMVLTDKLPYGLVTADKEFGTLMDTFAGPFCYRYN